jgi:hypothetical protein
VDGWSEGRRRPGVKEGLWRLLGSRGRQKPRRISGIFWAALLYQLVMFDWFRYRYELARLQRAHRKAEVPLEEEYQRARKDAKSDDEKGEALSAFMDVIDRYRDEEATFQTHYLCDRAAKRLIPLPEKSEAALFGNPERSSKWRRSTTYAGLILTDESIRELHAALRADRRERLEIVRSWVATIVPGLTGLVGVIIGLLAVILGRR